MTASASMQQPSKKGPLMADMRLSSLRMPSSRIWTCSRRTSTHRHRRFRRSCRRLDRTSRISMLDRGRELQWTSPRQSVLTGVAWKAADWDQAGSQISRSSYTSDHRSVR
jgi:hypothetical protein